MVFQRPGSVGLVALIFAMVILARSGNAIRSALHSTISDDGSSMGCIPRLFGDGDCDMENDTEDCGESVCSTEAPCLLLNPLGVFATSIGSCPTRSTYKSVPRTSVLG